MDIRDISYLDVKNNVTVNYKGNGNHRYIVNCTSATIDYNCAYNTDGTNPSASPGSQSHEIWARDPKFVSFSDGDFHLQLTSPCIDAGASLSQVTDDLDGRSRPQGATWDIGAFEYGWVSAQKRI
jgi:hypothetical protein